MVKDLSSQVNQLQGTDHQRRYNDLKAELKAYCLAMDFNPSSAVKKLVDEATLAKSDEKDKLVAIQDIRIAYSQRTGHSLDIHSAMFNILTTPAEIEADKVVHWFEQKSRPFPPARGFARPMPPKRPRFDRGCFACGDQGHSARDCPNKRKMSSGRRTLFAVLLLFQ